MRVFQQQEVRHSCRCSDERILGMLKSFTDEEKHSMIDDDGQINVTCEFCSTKYVVAPSEIGIEAN